MSDRSPARRKPSRGRASAGAPSPSPHGPPGAPADGPPTATIDEDAFAPRDADNRYGLYLVDGRDLRLVATSDKDGIGAALVAQDDDAREAGLSGVGELGRVGVLDRVERRWILKPWHRGESGRG